MRKVLNWLILAGMFFFANQVNAELPGPDMTKPPEKPASYQPESADIWLEAEIETQDGNTNFCLHNWPDGYPYKPEVWEKKLGIYTSKIYGGHTLSLLYAYGVNPSPNLPSRTDDNDPGNDDPAKPNYYFAKYQIDVKKENKGRYLFKHGGVTTNWGGFNHYSSHFWWAVNPGKEPGTVLRIDPAKEKDYYGGDSPHTNYGNSGVCWNTYGGAKSTWVVDGFVDFKEGKNVFAILVNEKAEYSRKGYVLCMDAFLFEKAADGISLSVEPEGEKILIIAQLVDTQGKPVVCDWRTPEKVTFKVEKGEGKLLKWISPINPEKPLPAKGEITVETDRQGQAKVYLLKEDKKPAEVKAATYYGNPGEKLPAVKIAIP